MVAERPPSAGAFPVAGDERHTEDAVVEQAGVSEHAAHTMPDLTPIKPERLIVDVAVKSFETESAVGSDPLPTSGAGPQSPDVLYETNSPAASVDSLQVPVEVVQNPSAPTMNLNHRVPVRVLVQLLARDDRDQPGAVAVGDEDAPGDLGDVAACDGKLPPGVVAGDHLVVGEGVVAPRVPVLAGEVAEKPVRCRLPARNRRGC